MNADDLIKKTKRSVNDISSDTWLATHKGVRDYLGKIIHVDTVEHSRSYDRNVVYRANAVTQEAYFIVLHEFWRFN